MSVPVLPISATEEELYRLKTATSRRFFTEARKYLPGGDSRSTLFYPPYPAVMDRGEECWLVDLDAGGDRDRAFRRSSQGGAAASDSARPRGGQSLDGLTPALAFGLFSGAVSEKLKVSSSA